MRYKVAIEPPNEDDFVISLDYGHTKLYIGKSRIEGTPMLSMFEEGFWIDTVVITDEMIESIRKAIT